MKTIHIFLITMFLWVSYVQAEDVATYSGSVYTGCQSIGDTNVFLNDPNDYGTVKAGYIYLPSGCGSLPQVAPKYLKVIGGVVQEMSQAEKDALDQAEADAQAQALLTSSRLGAKDSVDQLSPEGVRLRASLLVILEHMNSLKVRVDAVEACIEGAGTLSAAKTCLSGLSALGTNTALQMKTAIKARIDNGSAD